MAAEQNNMNQDSFRSSSRIVEVSLQDFQQQVLDASAEFPVLVDFWADWCPPCIAIAPVLEKVINEREKPIRLAKLEVDAGKNMKIAGQHKVRGFPTIILFSQGEEHARFSGAKSINYVEKFIADNITD